MAGEGISDHELASLHEAWLADDLQYAYRWLQKDGLESGFYEALARRARRVALALGWFEQFAEYVEAMATEDRQLREERLQLIEKNAETWEATAAAVRQEDLELLEAWLDRLANLESRLFGEKPTNAVGQRVRHPKFGLGTIIKLAGANATVRFDDGPEKRLRLSFLELLG